MLHAAIQLAPPRCLVPLRRRPVALGVALTLTLLASFSSAQVPCLPIFAAAVTAADPSPLTAAASVEISLTDGRRLHGKIDSATDSTALILSGQRSGMTWRHRFPWAQVVQLESVGRVWPANQAAEALGLGPVPEPALEQVPLPPPAGVNVAELPQADEIAPSSVRSLTVPYPHRLYFSSPARPAQATEVAPSSALVVSLAVDAQLANWDQDPEADGLVAYVAPLDDFGDVVPVRGSVTCLLVASRPGRLDSGSALPTIARWSRSLTPAKFSTRGQRLRLEFQAVLPELRTDLEAYGSLVVRVAIPGQGVFDATLGTLRLRSYDLLRDRRQLLGEPRPLPQETFGRLY